ncbi:carbamate kinase [Deltaproteobacteria bacterium OttesenSCG-928-K17]|nr:carbamate kinase [Deltaproteobacteria bacterium OttesenSCG-928-K17]
MTRRTAVIAIGGNSLISGKGKESLEDQHMAVFETTKHIADIIEAGYQVVVTHGNGPQVGFILARSDLAAHEIHRISLVIAVADTQGAIGYEIQQNLDNEMGRRGHKSRTVSLVTQVLVDKDDPGFKEPTKFIGGFYEESQLEEIKRNHPTWVLKPDSNRGWRRVVASPQPKAIVELEAVESMIKAGFNVVTVGGGGIPVVEKDGGLEGVSAVIDKDLATCLLAEKLKADLLIISTGVPQVSINFGKPNEEKLGTVTADKMAQYLAEGHFPPGSMGPKIEAALGFLKNGGSEVIITDPQNLGAAVKDNKGTHIVK